MKHIVRHGLQIQLLKQTFRNGALDDFIDSLSMNGRTSPLKLIGNFMLPEEELRSGVSGCHGWSETPTPS